MGLLFYHHFNQMKHFLFLSLFLLDSLGISFNLFLSSTQFFICKMRSSISKDWYIK